MKLSVWARETGIDYRTARRWVKNDTMPVPFTKLSTGTILVHPPQTPSGRIVGYARVSSRDQKDDLDRQVARLAQSGHHASEYVAEVGSALNGARPKLRRLLSDPEVSTIVVEHRDRLTQFGFELIEAALAGRGARIVVLEEKSEE